MSPPTIGRNPSHLRHGRNSKIRTSRPLDHSLCNMVKQTFQERKLPDVSQFIPISLCNVTYKVITKMIVNRFKILLPSPTQSSFVFLVELNMIPSSLLF